MVILWPGKAYLFVVVKFHGCLPHVERNEILWDVSSNGVYKSLTRRRSNS